MKPEYTKRSKKRVLLEGDWARLWLLLNHKILDEAQVIRAIGIQVEYEKHSVFDVIEEQGWISKKMANIFRQKITEKRIVRDQDSEITQQDKLLAEQLTKSNSIPQEKLHEWLQALDQLHLIGIKCSLTQLLTAREEIPVKKTLQQTDTQYKRKTTRAERKLPTKANELAWNKSDLTTDMLLLIIAFNEQILTKKEIAKILFAAHFYNESIQTTLQSKYFLSSETLQQLREKSQDAKIYKKKEFIHQADWQLADYITRYKVLPRAEVQNLLRILVELSTINIHYSLDALIADTQLLDRQQLHQLIEQCHRISKGKQLPQIEVHNIDPIHGSKTKSKNYTYLLWGLMVLVPVIFVVEIWMITTPSSKKVVKTSQKEVPVQHKKVKITESPAATTEKKVPKKELPEKEVSTLRSEKGFVPWGRFWIAKEQKNSLEKVVEVGEKFTSLKLYLDNISACMQADKKSLLLKGQMNTIPDFFPSDFPIKFYVVVSNNLKTQIYTETSFAVAANRQFEVQLQLPYELTPCILSVEIFFKPELQDKFTEYILNIEKRMNWKYAVFLGTKKQIQKAHDLYKEQFFNIVKAVQQQQRIINSSSLPKERMLSSMRDIAKNIKLLQQKSISYPYVTQDLSKLPDALEKLYNLDSKSKDFVEQQIFLELELHKIMKKYEKVVTDHSLIETRNVTTIDCEYPN